MTLHEVRRGESWWRYRIGFGVLQRARALAYTLLPDGVKRAQVANPDLTPDEVRKAFAPEDLLGYSRDLSIGIVALALDSAHDWDKAKVTRNEYVDGMPEDVGNEIVAAVQAMLLASEPSPSEKKSLG